MKENSGFTLIEIIIYIALFSLLIGTAFIPAYQLIDGSSDLSARNVTQEEGNFVMRKINWALTGISNDISDISSPSTTSPYSPDDELSIKKWISDSLVSIDIKYDAGTSSVLMKEGTGAFLPIATQNVKVTALQFKFTPGVGTGPASISATVTIDGTNFSVTKYIRK